MKRPLRALLVTRAAALCAALALCAASLVGGCAQQDPAARVTLTGQYLFPGDANSLQLRVYDGAIVFFSHTYPLTASMKFPLTVVLIESNGDHPHVKVEGTLYLSGGVVGQGSALANFQDGQTVDVALPLAP